MATVIQGNLQVRKSAKATVADYRALPETGPQYQLIEGELIVSPPPSRAHQEIVGTFFAALRDYGQRTGHGSVRIAPLDVFLSDQTVLQPDVLWLSREHLDRARDDGIHGPPDLCIEILSPSTAWIDKRQKLPLYGQHGVHEVWLVDALLEQVQLYRPQESAAKPVLLLERTEVIASPELPDFSLALNEVFPARTAEPGPLSPG